MDKVSGADKNTDVNAAENLLPARNTSAKDLMRFAKPAKIKSAKRRQRAYRLWESEHKGRI